MSIWCSKNLLELEQPVVILTFLQERVEVTKGSELLTGVNVGLPYT